MKLRTNASISCTTHAEMRNTQKIILKGFEGNRWFGISTKR
jgi:hypothetical protein